MLSKVKFSGFCGRTRETKFKREGLYQDYEKGGLRMVDFEILSGFPAFSKNGKQTGKLFQSTFSVNLDDLISHLLAIMM